jgi:hypothetical protein
MSSKRYIFDTECRVFPEGIRVRGMIVVHNAEAYELSFSWSEWHDNLKDAFNEAYDNYIHELALEALK